MRRLVLPVLVLLTSALFAQIPTDFEASYPFDGSLNDTTSNAWNGTLTGTTTYGMDRFGNPSGALSLDGSTLVSFGDLPLDQSFSISFWINGSNVADGQSLLSKRAICSVANFFDMKLNAATLGVEIRSSTNVTASVSTDQVTYNEWNHVIYINDADNKQSILYVNGQIASVTNQSGSFPAGIPNNGNLQLGNTPCSSPRYTGMFDDMTVFTRSITEEEALDLFLDKGFCPELPIELTADQPTGLPAMSKVTDLASPYTEAFELVAGTGDDDNASFFIANGDELYTSVDFDADLQSAYSILIQPVIDCPAEAEAVVLSVTNPLDDLLDNLLAGYSFDGNTDDINGVNNATSEVDITYGENRFGEDTSAAYLNGTTSRIIWTDLPTDQQFSISLWMKNERESRNNNQSLLSKRPSCGVGQYFDMRTLGSTNAIGIEARDDNALTATSSISVADPDDWHHMVVAFDNVTATTTLYLNGYEMSVRDWDGGASTMANNTALGLATSPCIGSDGTQRFMGYVDEILIFDTILTEVAARTLYHEEGYCRLRSDLGITNDEAIADVDVIQLIGELDDPLTDFEWTLDENVTDNELFVLDGDELWLTEEVSEMTQSVYNLELSGQTSCGLVEYFLPITVVTFEADTGLIAKYSFTGNAEDESGNGWNGSLFGGTYGMDRFGGVSKALMLDGNAYATFGDIPLDDLSWTLSFWLNPNALNANSQSVLSKRGGCTDGSLFDIRGLASTGALGMEGRNGSFGTFSAPSDSIPAGEWSHMAVVVDDATNTTSLYVNGEWVGTRDWVNNPVQVANTAQFAIANSPCVGSDGTTRFAGMIDDIRVFDYAVPAGGALALAYEKEVVLTSNQTEVQNGEIFIYPNPTQSKAHIAGKNVQSFVLMDQLGQSLLSGEGTEVPLDGLNKGIYLIQVNTTDGASILRVAKQ